MFSLCFSFFKNFLTTFVVRPTISTSITNRFCELLQVCRPQTAFQSVQPYCGIRGRDQQTQTGRQPTERATCATVGRNGLLLRRGLKRRLIAKFHYTDPTRTRHGPDTDKVRARCPVRAKFHYTDPTGPARTQRSFAAKKSPCGSGRVRVGSVSGPCSGI